MSVADPGFPVGGGGVDSRGGYVSKILYVKMKESGPLGGACAGHAPSRSAKECYYLKKKYKNLDFWSRNGSHFENKNCLSIQTWGMLLLTFIQHLIFKQFYFW